MRTEQVKYFLETVRTGSFTKAAENLHIHQTSLREAIITLENEVGKTLFIRSKKGVELTAAGRNSLPYFQMIEESYNRMCNGYGYISQGKTVAIDAQGIYSDYLLPFFTILKEQFEGEGIALDINIDDHVEVIMNRLIQNQTSMAFICTCRGIENSKYYDVLQKNQLEVTVIQASSVGVMMRKDHPLAKKQKLYLHDFKDYGFVFFSDSSAMKTIVKQKRELDSSKILVLSNRKLLEKYLKYSNMVTFMPDERWEDDDFVVRSLEDSPIMEYQAIYKKGGLTSELLRCINMMEIIQDSIETHY